jgi:hypothetical protein
MNTRACFDASNVDTPPGVEPVRPASEVTGIPSRGTGLSAELFIPDAPVSDLDMAEAAIRLVPDVTFIASKIAFCGTQHGETVADLLGRDAASIDGAGGDMECASCALTLSGFIFVPAGVHEIEVVCDAGFRLELGGLAFMEADGSQTPDATPRVAEFEGGLYEIDLLTFHSGNAMTLSLRIDGLPLDQSAFYRNMEDFEAPPEGTPLIHVEAYHPSFFRGADGLEAFCMGTATGEHDGTDNFADDDMILGLADDDPEGDLGVDVLKRGMGDSTPHNDPVLGGYGAHQWVVSVGVSLPVGDVTVKARIGAIGPTTLGDQSYGTLDIYGPGVGGKAVSVVHGYWARAGRAPHDRKTAQRPGAGTPPALPIKTEGHTAPHPGYDSPTTQADPTGTEPFACAASAWLQSGAVELASNLMGAMEPPVVLMSHEGGAVGGGDQPVELPHTPMLAAAVGTWAFIFTAHTPGNDQTQALFSKDHPDIEDGGRLTAYIRGDGVLKIRFQGEDGQVRLLDSGVKIEPNHHYHLAFTFDADEINLFLNGELVDTAVGFAGGMLDNVEDVVLGAVPCVRQGGDDSLKWHFNGVIESVMLLDRPITDVEAVFLSEAGGDIVAIDALYGLGEDDTEQPLQVVEVEDAQKAADHVEAEDPQETGGEHKSDDPKGPRPAKKPKAA